MPELLARILVADDEVYIREGLKEALEIPGYAIETVPDGDTVRGDMNKLIFYLPH